MKRAQEEWKHDIVYDTEGHNDLYICIDLLNGLKVHGELYGRSFKVALTYSMIPTDKVTFVVGLTLFMTPKGHRVIRDRCNLLCDPKGHGDFCVRFDLVYDPKRRQGH